MTEYREVAVGDIFEAKNGQPKYVRDYMDSHPGRYPVYSASITKPFGYVDSYDFDGDHLTWVMNGYGGRVQEFGGQFSATVIEACSAPQQVSVTHEQPSTLA